MNIRYELTDEEKKTAINYFSNFTKEELSELVFRYRNIISDYEDVIDEFVGKIGNYDSSKSI